jgi:hypothetical protein
MEPAIFQDRIIFNHKNVWRLSRQTVSQKILVILQLLRLEHLTLFKFLKLSQLLRIQIFVCQGVVGNILEPVGRVCRVTFAVRVGDEQDEVQPLSFLSCQSFKNRANCAMEITPAILSGDSWDAHADVWTCSLRVSLPRVIGMDEVFSL